MEKLKVNILLEVIGDIIIEYPDTKDFIQQMQLRSVIEKEYQ